MKDLKDLKDLKEKTNSGDFFTQVIAGEEVGLEIVDNVVFGFDSWKQLQDFASEFDGTAISYKKRDGQGWKSLGEIVAPYCGYEHVNEIMSDDFYIIDEDYLNEMDKEDENYEELQEALKDANSDDLVVACDGSYFDTIQEKMIECQEDVYMWKIGVELPFTELEEDEDGYVDYQE